MPLVDKVAIVAKAYSAVCQLHSRLRKTTRATKKLCGQKAYIYICGTSTLYIVDNTGRHDIDFGREGLINDLSFFSY